MQDKSFSYPILSQKEWIYTNGLGGYASSSVIGTNTRRYHGLLVASFNPPTERKVLVSRLEEELYYDADTYVSLSTNQYPSNIDPKGFQYFEKFNRKPLPEAHFKVEGYQIKKTVFMVQGSNTTVVQYANVGLKPFKLKLKPFLVYRDYHSLMHQNDYFDFYHTQKADYQVVYAHYGASPLFIKASKGEWQANKVWYHNHEYEGEKQRGLDFHEDSCTIGQFEIWLESGTQVYLTFSTDEAMMQANPIDLQLAEIERLKKITAKFAKQNEFVQDLLVAGEQFIVKRQSTDSETIIAGYHWFTDWGRDTMIALRGLCISTGKQATAKSILKTFFQYLNQGMLPNRFPDNGEEVEYNTIDATLWLFITLYEYYQKFGDKEFIAEVFDQLSEVIESHIRGTRYHIQVTPEGLLSGGAAGVQLTWMDARVGDYVVTPRVGCPVEINALWYNALKIHQYFALLLEQNADKYNSLIINVLDNFKTYFLNEDGYLNDVIIPDQLIDRSIRPNQIYALSLPFSLLSEAEEAKVLEVITEYLYTDFGLRSLNVQHPDFKAIYQGDPWQRDTSYHQGTVWAFLLGEYFAAYLKVNKHSKSAKTLVKKQLNTLKNHFYNDTCVHGISEIFDGENPQLGKGTIHQAWSIGAILKVILDNQLFDNQQNNEKSSANSLAGILN
jgi:predicted glycogen debranching enzyme